MLLTDPRPFTKEDYDFIRQLIASRTPCLLCGMPVRDGESFLASKSQGGNDGHGVWHHECLALIETEVFQ